jgi:hypothetical protein
MAVVRNQEQEAPMVVKEALVALALTQLVAVLLVLVA